jgi:glutaconate CoA-transferase subunit A
MSKIKGLAEALDGIEDGASIGIGGWIFNSQTDGAGARIDPP